MRRLGPALNEADALNHPRRDVFVPNGGDRKGTATLLVQAADKAGLPQNHIVAHPNGYFISDALADIVYDDAEIEDEDPETPDEAPAKSGSTTKTSGNRAEKK